MTFGNPRPEDRMNRPCKMIVYTTNMLVLVLLVFVTGSLLLNEDLEKYLKAFGENTDKVVTMARDYFDSLINPIPYYTSLALLPLVILLPITVAKKFVVVIPFVFATYKVNHDYAHHFLKKFSNFCCVDCIKVKK